MPCLAQLTLRRSFGTFLGDPKSPLKFSFPDWLFEREVVVPDDFQDAFDAAIKPSIKDYIPKREELISTATKLFWEGIKALG